MSNETAHRILQQADDTAIILLGSAPDAAGGGGELQIQLKHNSANK